MNRQQMILEEIAVERQRQDDKWGAQDHKPFHFLTILGEEYGEACEAALRLHWGEDLHALRDYRNELLQVAAVAVAAIERVDLANSAWEDATAVPTDLREQPAFESVGHRPVPGPDLSNIVPPPGGSAAIPPASKRRHGAG